MPDDVKIKNKLQRQLTLLAFMINTQFHSPYDVMTHFRYPNRRAMERDFKDLSDAGVIRKTYKKKDDSVSTFPGDETENDNYMVEVLLAEEMPKIATENKHLSELNYLAHLIAGLPQTDFEELLEYESEKNSEMREWEDDDWIDWKPELEDAVARYHKIFPIASEEDRERDFDRLNRLGFLVQYSEYYGGYLVDIRFCSEERHFEFSPRGEYIKSTQIKETWTTDQKGK